jgi:tape measure domain-containing protein
MVVQELIALLGFQVNAGPADRALDSMGTKMAGLAAAAVAVGAAIGVIAESVKGAARLESLNAEFEVMLKNADAAKYLVQEINKFAAATPYETEGLTSNVRLMMAFGQSAMQSLKAVKMLGDVAGSDQNRLNQLSLAYAQVFAAGKLQGNDMLQFVNAGFNPLTILAEKRKVSMAVMRKEMEQGKISAQMVQQAFEIATGKGGKFFGNMEKQSQTTAGLWSTLKDNFKMMMAELGTELLPYLKAVMITMIELTPAIGDAFRQLSAFFGIFAKDGPTAQDTAHGIATAFMMIADGIMLAFSTAQLLWAGLQGAFGVLLNYWSLIVRFFTWPFAAIEAAAELATTKLMQISARFGNIPGLSFLKSVGSGVQSAAGTVLTPGRFLQTMGNDSFGAAGQSWNKFLQMSSMIGGSKGAAPGSKVALTDKILQALTNGGKTINNNITNNVNVNAQGALKDILKEQANAAFSLTVLQTRLVAASV